MILETKGEYVVFTVCNLAYLPKALVLAESVLKYNQMRLRIYIFDKKVDLDVSSLEADLCWIEELDIAKFQELAFQYDIIELSTSLKPFLTLRLLGRFDKVIFLDPDTCLYHSVMPILTDLDKHPIVLTPHYTTPQSDHPTESDLGMMRFGSFNLGFYAVNGSVEARKFLEWWSQRCIDLSFMESQYGLSTDQKWVTIAPCLFHGIHISYNLGYNAAPWNTYEREMMKLDDGNYVINGRFPLIFFHFSNFDAADPEYLNKRATTELGVHKPALLELAESYSGTLSRMKEKVGPYPYSYDYMSDGEYVSPTLRRAYASVRAELPLGHDPFEAKGPVGQFARKNHLLEKNSLKYVSQGFKDSGKHKYAFSFVYSVMRTILRIIGPNRFFNLSRLLVYISMYRKNRILWKL